MTTEPGRPHAVPPPARTPGQRPAPAARSAAHAPRSGSARRRASKGLLRTLAWLGGAVGFVSPWAALAVAPKPVAAQPAPAVSPRPTIIVHHIIRKVIVTERAPSVAGPVTTTSGGVVYVPAAAPPVASSGGSSP